LDVERVLFEGSLKIKHTSIDVVRHLLTCYPNAESLTLYGWDASVAVKLSPHLEELTVISAAPQYSLIGCPKTLTVLRVYDSGVTDAGIINALGRGDKRMQNLRSLDLMGTSVTGAFPGLLPRSLESLSLSSTPTNDEGLLSSGICVLKGNGSHFPHLHTLDLSHTRVSSQVLKTLPRKITELNLSFTSIETSAVYNWLGK
jgi:hypothetical protein